MFRTVLYVAALLVLAAPPCRADGPAPLTPQAVTYTAAAELRDRLSQWSLERRAELLLALTTSGIATQLDEVRLIAVLQGTGPDAAVEATRRYLADRPTYEAIFLKQERVKGRWPEVPDRILIRVRSQPFGLYGKWLSGGRHEGLQIFHDATRDPGNIRAHVGGFLSFIKVTLPLDHWAVRRDTNHRVTDMGLAATNQLLADDLRKLRAAASPTEAKSIRLVTHRGRRVVELRYEHPGPPVSYAHGARVLYDLEEPIPRLLELYDAEGTLAEYFEFESITWKELGTEAFDPENPDYDS